MCVHGLPQRRAFCTLMLLFHPEYMGDYMSITCTLFLFHLHVVIFWFSLSTLHILHVGRAAFSSGSSSATPNTYVQTRIRNNLHSSDDKLSEKAQDHFDDPSDIIQERELEPKIIDTASKQPNSPTLPSKRDSSYSSSPSHSGEPSSPIAKVLVSTRRRQHHYQNVIEIRCAVEEPPPNYDELDDLPPVHDVSYRGIPNSVSFSAVNALADQDDLGEGSGFGVRTMDSGIGSTTHEVDVKHDMQLPPLSPHDHETML